MDKPDRAYGLHYKPHAHKEVRQNMLLARDADISETSVDF
jgi:hypothetical protein